MKNLKIFSILILLFSTILLFSCQKSNNINGNSDVNQIEELAEIRFSEDEYLSSKRKFVLRHYGNGRCVCDGCKCPQCPCPLGVCTCFWDTFDPSSPYLTQLEKAEDIGSLSIFKLSNNKVKLVFDQITALENGYVPLGPDDLFLSKEESLSLGFNDKVALESGEYLADFSNNEFGEIIVDV